MPTLKARIAALHAQRPDLTAREAAELLDCGDSVVRRYSKALKLKWKPGK